MIPRYDKSEISDIWTEENKFKIFLDVELAVLKVQEGKNIPTGISDKIRKIVSINRSRIDEIEKVVHHDVIAFCTSITEQLPEDIGKFFHYGVTSSDIIDTVTNLQVKQSLSLIISKLKDVLASLKDRAISHKDILCLGRSHGMYAEPMSFGQKFLGHYAEFKRRLKDLENYYEEEITGQFSGAVGNYTITDPEIEEMACKQLGIKADEISTQVIPRDRLAKLVNINALVASAIERLATEIRHLHRSEVGELHEGFAKGQKGSSIMPHKKNPISGENLTGIARVLRSHATIAMENITLWHERDISHSSAERLYLPDNLGLVYYALDRLNSTIERLDVHQEMIEGRVKDNFIYLSSYYLHQLLKTSHLTREDAYKIIQNVSFASQGKGIEDYYNALIQEIKKAEISTENFNLINFTEIKSIYMKHVDTVFERVLT